MHQFRPARLDPFNSEYHACEVLRLFLLARALGGALDLKMGSNMKTKRLNEERELGGGDKKTNKKPLS